MCLRNFLIMLVALATQGRLFLPNCYGAYLEYAYSDRSTALLMTQYAKQLG